jgi:DNA-binding beta-propeller fold protein YncE/mono/diheme cytochrome c family protein
MNKRSPFPCAVLVVLALSAMVSASPYRSPCALALSPDGGTLYIAEHTGQRISVWDVEQRRVKTSFGLHQRPNGLALTADGATLLVTVGEARGQLLLLDARSGQVRAALATGHTPMAPVIAGNDTRVYLCCRFEGTVEVFDLHAVDRHAVVTVGREPIALGLSPDQATLLVAHHLPTQPADAGTVSADVRLIGLEQGDVRGADQTVIALPNGSTGVRGLCFSPDGRYGYVTHILARYQLPTTQVDRGWMNTNALSVIDMRQRQWLNTVLLDNVDRGAANPWAVACTEQGAGLVVAHAGTQELSLIDRAALHEKIDQAAQPDAVRDNLAFIHPLRRFIRLSGNGPRALVTRGQRAYVAEYFTDSLSVVDLAKATLLESHPLGEKVTWTSERQGEVFFNDASLCFQQWQSCATCHPDARTDGLNWDLLNDGMGNPKNTRSMLRSHETPPAMVTGIRPDAEAAVRAGIRHIQFVVRPEQDAQALDAYLRSLEPVPSPQRVAGQLSDAARRGESLFTTAGCSRCHHGPNYTDLKTHRVGTGRGRDVDQAFDTPALVEVWRTAPYLYDGHARTIEAVLRDCNLHDQHGKTSQLTEAELADLAAYVLSL